MTAKPTHFYYEYPVGDGDKYVVRPSSIDKYALFLGNDRIFEADTACECAQQAYGLLSKKHTDAAEHYRKMKDIDWWAREPTRIEG